MQCLTYLPCVVLQFVEGALEGCQVADVDTALREKVEADCYWGLTKLLDGIQVRGCLVWGGRKLDSQYQYGLFFFIFLSLFFYHIALHIFTPSLG